MHLISCESCGAVYDLDNVILKGEYTEDGYDDDAIWVGGGVQGTFMKSYECHCGQKNPTNIEVY